MHQYKRLSEVEHVLTRSGMYLGNTNNIEREAFVIENDKMVLKLIQYNPALVKMFDEIISNSADESIRSGNVKNIWVTTQDGKISVKDDGGIPVEKHKEYGVYIPEMLFGELRSGSNFNDDERVTAGMNGLGSVLVNIFSKEFTVETCDGKNKFTQTYTNNLSNVTEPTIKTQKTKGTTITFMPDYERLNCTLNDNNMAMIEKRCYDIAGNFPNVKVHFNNKLINVKTFVEFSEYFTQTEKIAESNSHWDVVVTSSMQDDTFRHVSYVNGIDTYEGGTHVNFIVDQLTTKIREFVKKKHKIDVKPNTIKQCLFVFVKAKINAPMFNSQTKEMLNNDVKTFESAIELSDKFINKILKSDIITKVLDWVEAEKRKNELAELRKVNKQSQKASLRHIVKFDDASSKEREKCTLVLCEGDCLDENTSVHTIHSEKTLKDILIGDLVLTHKNRYKRVTHKQYSVKDSIKIVTTEFDLICSPEHKLFVYSRKLNKFGYLPACELDLNDYELVKTRLIDTFNNKCEISYIKENDDTYDIVVSEIGLSEVCTIDHKYYVFDGKTFEYIFKNPKDIDVEYDYFVYGLE